MPGVGEGRRRGCWRPSSWDAGRCCSHRPSGRSSVAAGDGVDLLPRFSARPVEHFGLVLLDVRCRVIRTALLSVGTIDATTVHPREVFREATVAGASSVVLFHNHPSGDPSPSPDDVRLTARLVRAGEVMGIEVIDHLILADHRYYSFRESGGLARLDPAVTLDQDPLSGLLLGRLGRHAPRRCLDAGVPLDDLRAALGSLGLDDYDGARRSGVLRPASPPPAGCSTSGSRLARCRRRSPTREQLTRTAHVAQIEAADRAVGAGRASRDRAIALFRAAGEPKRPSTRCRSSVHLHEVGALDSIVDIVGAVFAIEWFGAERIVASPLNLGGGMVDCAHGTLSGAGAGDRALLQGCRSIQHGPAVELMTPTGALLVTGYADASGRCRRCASIASATAPAPATRASERAARLGRRAGGGAPAPATRDRRCSTSRSTT